MVKKVIRFIVLIIGLSLVAYSGYHLFKIYSDYNTCLLYTSDAADD